MSRPISTLMTRHVHTVGIDDPIDEVASLMESKQLQWVPVLDETRELVGVISQSDLLHARTRQVNGAAPNAWQVCSYRPLVVTPDTPIELVARQMVERQVHHVVVASPPGRIEGVVSSLDFVAAMAAGAGVL